MLRCQGAKRLCLYILQVAVSLVHFLPALQLAVEESLQGVGRFYLHFPSQRALASLQLYCAQSVLVKVVCVYLLYAQCCIAVSSPPAAEVQFLVYPAYAEVSAKGKSEGIILTITRVGETYLAEQRGEECSRSSEPVYAKGIVRSILLRPLLVIYYARRQGVEVEITHTVSAYHHSCLLLVEAIHYLLQGVRTAVKVVRVQLNGKTSAFIAIYSLVPATSYA